MLKFLHIEILQQAVDCIVGPIKMDERVDGNHVPAFRKYSFVPCHHQRLLPREGIQQGQ